MSNSPPPELTTGNHHTNKQTNKHSDAIFYHLHLITKLLSADVFSCKVCI